MDDFDCDPTPDVWYGRFSWSRLCLKLAIAYVVLAFFCWEEMRYRLAAVDVAAEVKVVGRDNQGRSLVRYTFRDPQTGAHRENTVAIAAARQPAGATATVQYIPGELFASRLASQARPHIVAVFAATNAVLVLGAAGLIGYWAWEANHRPLTRQQRAVAAYRRKRRMTG
jgi:hypothetical protein